MAPRRFSALVGALFAFLFIAAPAIVGLFFVLAYPELPYFYMWVIALAFLLYAFFLTWLFYYLKILRLSAFNFNVPLSIVLASLFVARDLPWWAMLIISLSLILTAIPANMVTARLSARARRRGLKVAKK